MNETVTEEKFKSATLESFSHLYGTWHGYLSIVICALGIILNVFNVIVLTRKKMQTPINCLLTWLAVSDMSTMLSYIPFAYHFYCEFPTYSISAEKNNKSWMTFLLVHLNFSATTHTISIWLAVALAIFRHKHLNSPAKGSLTRIRRLIRARIVISLIVCASVIIMIPNYIIHKLEEYPWKDNSTLFVFEDWKLGSKDMKTLVIVALIMYSVLAKLLPCFLIILYGGLLLKALRDSVKAKMRLSRVKKCMSYKRDKSHSRTTVMLLTVIILFLVTELPQGVLILCSIFLDKFFEHIYIPLGDVMDMLALVNNAINFVLYCSMSNEFRRTFVGLFCSCTPLKTTSSQSTQSQSQGNLVNSAVHSYISMYTKSVSVKEESSL